LTPTSPIKFGEDTLRSIEERERKKFGCYRLLGVKGKIVLFLGKYKPFQNITKEKNNFFEHW